MISFFTIIGWLVFLAFTLYVTFIGVIGIFSYLHGYTIVENPIVDILVIVIMWVIILAIWYCLFKSAPFTISRVS